MHSNLELGKWRVLSTHSLYKRLGGHLSRFGHGGEETNFYTVVTPAFYTWARF
jgi:hypothetical protein